MLRLIASIIGLAVFLTGVAEAGPTAKAKFNLQYPHIPNQLIVKFKSTTTEAYAAAVLNRYDARTKYRFKSRGAQLITFKKFKSDNALYNMATTLANLAEVEYVEANTVMRANDTVPNDTDFAKLWSLRNEGQTGGTAGADIDSPAAWDVTTGSKDVVVGVIDTGVDYNHPDIKPNYWQNPGETGLDKDGKDKSSNGVDDDGNGYIDDWRGWDFANDDNDPLDDHSHGTHCSGTIGAKGNDGLGIVGVNWDVSIVGIKFLDAGGSGSLDGAVKAIEYSNTLGLTLTSNSWGGGGFSQTMFDAISAADKKGILFIAAAGNNGENTDQYPHYPSTYDSPNVVSVAATDHQDGIADFSNHGAKTVHLGAPGVDIYSSVVGGGYDTYSGTSMATPHVSGVVALIKARFPNADHRVIKSRLLSGVDPIPSLAGKTVTGGRLNARNSLEEDSIAPGAVGELQMTTNSTTSATASWTPAGDDGEVGEASGYYLKISANPINSSDDWSSANDAIGAQLSREGGKILALLPNLGVNFKGYLTVRARDNVGNVGPISASTAISTREAITVYANEGESMDGITAEAPWGVEDIGGKYGKVFSDSPGAKYVDNLNISMTLPQITLPTADSLIEIEHSFALESHFDFVYVEMSQDNGATWTSLKIFTGTEGWRTDYIGLQGPLSRASAPKTNVPVLIRCRIETDVAVVKDGWKIARLKVLSSQ